MQVILSKTAEKQYHHLSSSEKNKVKKKLHLLEINPLAGKKLSGELLKYRSLRAWPYRIIYISNVIGKRIEVVDIEHRQGVYK